MISENEFIRAMMKVGVSGFTEANLKEIFNIYDLDFSGELSYKEFSEGIFRNSNLTSIKSNENSKKNFLDRNE